MAQIPPLDPTKTRWDYYKQFHQDLGPFTIFQSGEMVVTYAKPKPHLRCHYSKRNVRLGATGDRAVPLFFDKACTEPVPHAWLTHRGHQYFVADYDTGVVVRLKRGDDSRVPRRACAYFPGPGEPPLGAEFAIARPKKFTKDERQQLQDLRVWCRARVAMEGGKYGFLPSDNIRVYKTGDSTHIIFSAARTKVLATPRENLSTNDCAAIAVLPWEDEREITKVPNLWVPVRKLDIDATKE